MVAVEALAGAGWHSLRLASDSSRDGRTLGARPALSFSREPSPLLTRVPVVLSVPPLVLIFPRPGLG